MTAGNNHRCAVVVTQNIGTKNSVVGISLVGKGVDEHSYITQLSRKVVEDGCIQTVDPCKYYACSITSINNGRITIYPLTNSTPTEHKKIKQLYREFISSLENEKNIGVVE